MAERWLDRDALARYICVRVDYLPRMQRAGKLPPPSYHAGPRCPRWDRDLVDAAFSGSIAAPKPVITAEQMVDDILARRFSRRKKEAGRRHG
jgi:hypothetical protein